MKDVRFVYLFKKLSLDDRGETIIFVSLIEKYHIFVLSMTVCLIYILQVLERPFYQ